MASEVIAESVREAVAAELGDGELELLLPGLSPTMLPETRERAIESAKRGRGRPKGAQNLANREMLDYVRKIFGDPVERRARWLLHTPESLALALGCTRLEAFDRLDKIAAELARLFYPTLAPIDGQGNAVVPRLTVHFGDNHAHVDGRAVRPPWEYDVEQNQALAAPAAAQSHGEQSHDDENGNDHSGLPEQAS